MADQILPSRIGTLKTKYKDMGDGSHARVEAAILVDASGNAISASASLPTESTNAVPVQVVPQKTWRNGFDAVISNGVDTNFNTLLQTGSGMTVNQASGSLVITSGTTTYSETIIRSVQSWKDTFKFRYFLTLSQRIANNDTYIELVDVIGDGLAFTVTNATTIVVTVPGTTFTSQNVGQSIYIGALSLASCLSQKATLAAVSGTSVTLTVSGFPGSGSGTCSLFGWNYHHVLYTSTTATQAAYGTQRNGWAANDTTATINTSASGHLGIMVNDGAKAAFFDKPGTTGLAWDNNQRASSDRNIPATETALYMQIRVVNGSSAPGSTTTATVGFVEMDNYIQQQVSVVGIEPFPKSHVIPIEIDNLASGLVFGVGGSAATNIGKAEDAVANSGDVGVMVLGVRRDALVASAANGDYNEMAVNQHGSLNVIQYEKMARTYSAMALGLASAASATDIFTIAGSGSSTVVVTALGISGTQTTGGEIDIQIIKRSAVDTTGTSTTPTAVPHDSADAAANAVLKAYTANPGALGSAVGTIRSAKLSVPAPASPQKCELIFDFGARGKPVYLKGAAEQLAVNLNSVTVTGGNFDIWVEWYEY